jgi:hypothetical protein
MKRSTWPRNKLVVAFGGLAIVVLIAAAPGSAGAAPSAGSMVLSPTYAKSVGFPKTVQAAKGTKVTTQKGCTQSYEAVYEDAGSKTGLVSETLQCNSKAAATKALTTARKQVKVDSSFKAPKKLGSTAFVTATDAPEYLIAWIAGSKVAITAIDVNIAASTSSSTSTTVAPTPLTAAQMKTLGAAALKQNSLYN